MRKLGWLVLALAAGLGFYIAGWIGEQESAPELLLGGSCLLGLGLVGGIVIGSLWTGYMMRSGARLGNDALHDMARTGASAATIIREIGRQQPQPVQQLPPVARPPFPALRDFTIGEDPVDGDFNQAI